MIEIPLTQGQVTIIDDCDRDLVSITWSADFKKRRGVFYARAYYDGVKKRSFYLHRAIMSRILGRELKRCEQVDHKDLDTLNNRRENLRLATNGQNQANITKQVNNKSGYKGVCWNKRTGKWVAQICMNGRNTGLGYFTNIEDAAEAYKQAATKYHGEFARFE